MRLAYQDWIFFCHPVRHNWFIHVHWCAMMRDIPAKSAKIWSHVKSLQVLGRHSLAHVRKKKCHVESLKRHNLWFPSSSSMKLVGLRFQKTKDNEGLLINECIFKSGVCFWNLMHCWEPWLWTLLSPKQAINTKTLAANFVSILSQRCLKQLWAQASTQQSLSLRNSPFFRFSPSLRGVDLASLFKNVAFLQLKPRVATSAFKRNIKSASSSLRFRL